MSSRDRHGEQAALEIGVALGLAFEYRFPLGEFGTVDWWAKLDDRRLVFLEVEIAQRHPSTNVAKCWPWLKENPAARVLLIQAYDKSAEERRPKGSRRRLASFLGAELRNVLDGRFRHLELDVPAERAALHEIAQAVDGFRSPSDALDRSKPLFAYGFLRPGELAYHQLAGDVVSTQSASVSGSAFERDGLLILSLDGDDEVPGDILRFKESRADAAYRAIDDLEPKRLYRWSTLEALADGERVTANALVAAKPARGSHPLDDDWSSRTDPLFNEALEEIDSILEPWRPRSEGSDEVRSFFRLQMAYLLLWSAIERYACLRWGFAGGPVQRVKRLAQEEAFVRGLREHSQVGRVVYRADDPGSSALTLDPTDPARAIDFYYQVRSNITHRGKAAYDELSLVGGCLSELRAIFGDVLAASL